MMTVLKLADAAIGKAMRWFCITVFAGLTAVLSAVVFIRFFPVAKLSWSDEIIEWMMAALIFVAAAALWRENDHFKIEALSGLVLRTLPGRVFLFAIEVLTGVFIAFFAFYSLDLTLSVGRTSPILSWPMTWWYVTMPVAGFIMLAYSIRNVVQGIRSIADALASGRT